MNRAPGLRVAAVVASLLLLFSCATSREASRGVTMTAASEVRAVDRRADESEFYLLPEKGPQFWEQVMTPEIAYRFRAIDGRSQCTAYVADVLKNRFGKEVFEKVFPEGVKGSNETFVDWTGNHSLLRLSPDEYSIDDIQKLVNDGCLVLMAYYYPEIAGHVAFVGNRALKLFTIPPIPDLEGKSGSKLDRSYLPVMVQAGTYTGITSMVYATNGWLRNDNFGRGVVRYYVVKTGD